MGFCNCGSGLCLNHSSRFIGDFPDIAAWNRMQFLYIFICLTLFVNHLAITAQKGASTCEASLVADQAGVLSHRVSSKVLRWMIVTLSNHHSRDTVFLGRVKQKLDKMNTTTENQPWRCKVCWRLVKAVQPYCPSCGGWWGEVNDSTFQPNQR